MRRFKRTLSLILAAGMLLGSLSMSAGAAKFSDTENHWAQSAIERWSGLGILTGNTRGDFLPDQPVTRGALAKIIADTMHYTEQAANRYADLPATEWYTPYVLKCVAAGVLNGYSDGKMYPEAYVNRQEACTMLCTAFGIAPKHGAQADFADASSVADWAMPYVAALYEAGYISGVGGGHFAPEQILTRASAVTVLDNAVAGYITAPGAYSETYRGIVIVTCGGVDLTGASIQGSLIVTTPDKDSVTVKSTTVSGSISSGTGVVNILDDGKEEKPEPESEDSSTGAIARPSRPSGGSSGGSSGSNNLIAVRAENGETLGNFPAGSQLTVNPANGNPSYPVTVTAGLTIANPSRKGFAFNGWLVSGSTITAQWVRDNGAVTLDWHTYAMACGRSNEEGETLTLTASYDETAYSAPEIRWSSSAADIVAVQSENGDSATVQAKTSGFANVTAALYDGDKLIGGAVCEIASTDGYDRTTMQALSLSAERLTLQKDGGPVTLTPLFFPVDIPADGTMDTSLEIVGDHDASVIEVSLNEDQDYAAFADIGNLAKPECRILYDQVVVKPVGVGETTFTVRSKVNGRAASCTVTVTEDALRVTGLTGGSEETIELTAGENGKDTRQLAVVPQGGESDIIWTSSNPHIAAVDENGLVTARSTSNYEERQTNSSALDANDSNFKTVTITATSVQGGFTQSFRVKVLPQATQATGISINRDELSLAGGTQGSLYASVNPASVLSPDVQWSSSNESVVAVQPADDTVFGAPSVRLDARSAGVATVTASYAGFRASCRVTVTGSRVPVSKIAISGPDVLVRDQVAALEARVDGNATDPRVYWLSDDRSIVTVDPEGNLQGYDAGEASVYAIALDSLEDEQKERLFFTADPDESASNQRASNELGEIRSISASEEATAELEALLDAPNVVYDVHKVTVDGSASIYLRNLHIPEETVTDRSVALVWNRDSLYRASGLRSTEIRVNGKLTATLGNEMSYTVRDLSPATRYTFEVTSYYDGGSVSETVTATTDPAPVQVLNVMEYGAAGDGSTLDTAAIQSAIDACPAGGEVWLPEGHIFYSGALFLKSDITFRVDGILMGSADPKDYPRIVSRWEGWRKLYQPANEWANENEQTGKDYAGKDNEYVYASLLTVGVYDEGENGYTAPCNIENVTICGEGQINANGYRLGYNEGPNSAVKGGNNGINYDLCRQDQTIRGHVLVTHNVNGLYVADVMIANGPAWTIDMIYSKNVTLDNVAVVSLSNYKTNVGSSRNYILNGDGCDVDSSTHVNILNSFFRAGDDAIAVKSGKNREGWLRGKPTAYLRVSDVYSVGSRYGLIIGSEMAGGAHDVLFQNNEFKDNVSDNSMWIKAPTERGGLVEDITYRDIFNNSKQAAILVRTAYTDSYKATPAPVHTRIRRLTYENIIDHSSNASSFGGKDVSIIEDVVIRGVVFKKPVELSYVDGVQLIEVEGGYTDKGHAENVTIRNEAQETDVLIRLAEAAADVKEIDSETATVSVRKGTTLGQLLAQIRPEKADNGSQQYALTDRFGDAQTEEAYPLVTGDILTVTAKNGKDTKPYTVKIYQEAEIPASTDIEVTDSSVITALQGTKITVAAGSTAGDVLKSFRSVLGGEQTCEIFNDSDERLDENETLENGFVLKVTSQNGEESAEYTFTMEIPSITYNLIGETVSDKSESLADDKIKPENKNGSDSYFQAQMAQGEYFTLATPLKISSTSAYQASMSAKTSSSRGIFEVVLIGEDRQEHSLGSIDMRSSGGLTIAKATALEAGEYQLKFVCTTAGYFTGRNITLTPTGEPDNGDGDEGEEPEDPANPDKANNLARNATVTVSGQDSNRKGNQTPEMAVDGILHESLSDCSNNWDLVNGWKSQTPSATDKPWILVDLGDVHTLETLKTFWEKKDNRCYRYAVEVSTDGQTYTEVIDRRENADYHETVDALQNIPARYVKVTIYDCKDKSGKIQQNTVVTIRELEVYGE